VHRPYPILPVTLGDFILRRRLDLNLTQKQTAQLLKTNVASIRNWENNRHEISLPFRPRVIEFIGYCPCDTSLPLGLSLKERRENFGLSIKQLASILKVDPSTIAYWEKGEHQPIRRSRKIINDFLFSYLG
jgi:transcriptional regulator with XRE-family HTH domain